jgi:hypothetical protein
MSLANPQFVLAPFQPYKLHYAGLLVRVGTFHHVILQSKHTFDNTPSIVHVTNLTPGSD